MPPLWGESVLCYNILLYYSILRRRFQPVGENEAVFLRHGGNIFSNLPKAKGRIALKAKLCSDINDKYRIT